MKTIFVVGGGSSLEDFDFARLDNVETIAVNESFFSLNNPTYFVTLDGGWIRNLGTLTEHRERFKKFLESKAIKYYINPRGTDSHKGIDKVIHSHIVSPFDNEKFGHGYNSGFSATQLASQTTPKIRPDRVPKSLTSPMSASSPAISLGSTG